MRALGLVFASVLAAAVAACGGGGDDQRARVEMYIRSANTVEQRYAPEFERANDAYGAYARGELRPRRAEADLTHAAGAIQSARGEIAELGPPPDARRLHDKLLRYLGMNLAFARETARLAMYSPGAERALAPLNRANRDLSRRLADARVGERQADALQAFTRRLAHMLSDLRALDVPAVLRLTHRDQVRRLDSTRSLAEQLRRALLDQDAREVARLLKRFRANAAERGDRRRLAVRGIRRYNRRYEALIDAYQDVQREQARLDQDLRPE